MPQFLLNLSDRDAAEAMRCRIDLKYALVARFTKGQCQPCPARGACTTSRDAAHTVGFPPRELYDLQIRNPCQPAKPRLAHRDQDSRQSQAMTVP